MMGKRRAISTFVSAAIRCTCAAVFVFLICLGILLFVPFRTQVLVVGRWGAVQIVRSLSLTSVWGASPAGLDLYLDTLERDAWAYWENEHESITPVFSPGVKAVPELDPDAMTAADINLIDFSKPFIVRSRIKDRKRALSIASLQELPFSELIIDFFSDARKALNVVPDARGRLGEVVRNITQGGPAKIGTQRIVQAHPELLNELATPEVVTLWGDRFKPEDMGLTLTVPVFLATGGPKSDRGNECIARKTVRTDLHCEPISNVAVHIEGKKKWLLVAAEHWKLLRPSVAPDGRAYLFSRLDPFDPHALDHVPHYEIIANSGDILWVPSWCWHRVDYLPGETALAASLFHLRLREFFSNNLPFALVSIPNIIKEIIGIKLQ